MVKEQALKELARLALVQGVNLKKGQPLYIQADAIHVDFVNLCVELAYQLGSGEVIVDLKSQEAGKFALQYGNKEDLVSLPQYQVEKIQYLMDKGAAQLKVLSPMPGLLEGIDSQLIHDVTVSQMSNPTMMAYRNYSMANKGQWCLVALPNQSWAKKVFPDMEVNQAMDALWDAILDTLHFNDSSDVVAYWQAHNKRLKSLSKKLNDYNFKSLHFQNSLGTDIEVGLIKDHIWCGGSEIAGNGQEFNPNMPTEEVFTMPDPQRINGRVVATKPLNYGGVLIEDFSLVFKDGRVVEIEAEKNKETLVNLVNMDEGSSSLGEIALVSYDSPISMSGILFYNTLFDENASCHMALGASYPMNIKGGTKMTTDQLKELGANQSKAHVDFMFGSRDLSIRGICYDGSSVLIFDQGNFVD